MDARDRCTARHPDGHRCSRRAGHTGALLKKRNGRAQPDAEARQHAAFGKRW